MTQKDSWALQYKQIMAYMKKHKRRPSKYRPEDRTMHNWIKYNKKLLAKGELPKGRIRRFNRLLETAAGLRRLNQYAYMGEVDDDGQLQIAFGKS